VCVCGCVCGAEEMAELRRQLDGSASIEEVDKLNEEIAALQSGMALLCSLSIVCASASHFTLDVCVVCVCAQL
jgi:hypothetical protein